MSAKRNSEPNTNHSVALIQLLVDSASISESPKNRKKIVVFGPNLGALMVPPLGFVRAPRATT